MKKNFFHKGLQTTSNPPSPFNIPGSAPARCTEKRFLSPFVPSGWTGGNEILWAIYSLLLIRIWDGECVAYLEILEGHNNVIHKSSPTPLLTKYANELITLSQLMNLVARGSVALSIRL